MIPLALIAADAVTTSVGLATGQAEEANPGIAHLPGAWIVVLGILASMLLAQLVRFPGWPRRLVMVWLAAKGITVAWNMAVLLA